MSDNAALVEIRVEQADGQLKIVTKYPERGIGRNANVSVDYVLTIPASADVAIKTVSGNVKLERLR
ncbi:MAG: hypothetical protein V2A71_02440 [Candidatus Eisenbacteria bacterium]